MSDLFGNHIVGLTWFSHEAAQLHVYGKIMLLNYSLVSVLKLMIFSSGVRQNPSATAYTSRGK